MHFCKPLIMSALFFLSLPSNAIDHNSYVFINTVANTIPLSTAKIILATTYGVIHGFVSGNHLHIKKIEKRNEHGDVTKSTDIEDIALLAGACTGLLILPHLVDEESHKVTQYIVKGSAAAVISIPLYFITKATWRRINTYINTLLRAKSDI